MGSGLAPYLGYANAAYQRQLRYYPLVSGGTYWWSNVDAATSTYSNEENANCYSENYFTGDPNWFDYIYFGGAGRGASCP
jgi:hypothetical protein